MASFIDLANPSEASNRHIREDRLRVYPCKYFEVCINLAHRVVPFG